MLNRLSNILGKVPPFAALLCCLFVGMLLGWSTATPTYAATYTPPVPNVPALPVPAVPSVPSGEFDDGRILGERYVYPPGGQWVCLAQEEDPADDPCVFQPDAEGDPIPVTPDNSPRPQHTIGGFLPDGTDVRATFQAIAYVTTPPPADPIGQAPTVDQDQRTEPQEDGARFDCRRHGNGVCGPGNTQGHAAGCYVRTGKRAGTLIRPWDAAMAADQHYRPDGCGVRTERDRAMDDRLNGTVGQLCAATATGDGTVCWFADQPRPDRAHGPVWRP